MQISLTVGEIKDIHNFFYASDANVLRNHPTPYCLKLNTCNHFRLHNPDTDNSTTLTH